ncbi:MAG: ABC transporter substrate-binding protein [Clostridiales bacterium]|nr:ABC transporter substrate-binding protein [Clostridiales bacterium]
MVQKILALLLAVTMMLGLVNVSVAEEMPNVVIAFMSSTIPTDLELVQNTLNEILAEKIGVTVTLRYFTFADFTSKMNLILASKSEQMDIIPLLSADWTPYVSTGKLLDITQEYEEYGTGIQEYLDDEYLAVGQLGDTLYGVPAIYCWAQNAALLVRTDILEMAGLEEIPEKMDIYELTEVFEKINAAGNTMPIVGVEQDNSILGRVEPYDGLTDEFGVLMDYGRSLTVENWFETEEYYNLLKLMREWNEKGFIAPDSEITTDTAATLVKNGVCAGWIGIGDPGSLPTQQVLTGHDLSVIQLTTPTASTSGVGLTHWCLPVTCQDKVSAMKVLNEMYSNPEVLSIMDFGVPGVHYDLVADGVMRMPEGMTADNSGYYPHVDWYVGNQFIGYVWEELGLDYITNLAEYVESAQASLALGFTFDSTEYSAEIAALINARDQYRAALECGVVDPDEVLPQMQQALKDAGIDDIIAAKQVQLDAWLATK